MQTLDANATRNALHAYGLDRPAGVGFAFVDRARDLLYDWHAHDYHQLLYATGGPAQLETDRGLHILPQGRAIWIPAETRHRTLISGGVASLYFSTDGFGDDARNVRILTANPLLQEMILHALRWPLGASEIDPLADSFLRTLALLCGEWLESELPLCLPTAKHVSIRRAIDYALTDLASASLSEAVATAALSERTFRRLFTRDTGLTWQAWLARARIRTAMALLIQGERVSDVAIDVGYSSLSAFAKAFAQIAGEGPAQFRQRHAKAD